MSWTEYGALLVLAAAMSFTPGPNTTLSAALGANFGFRAALRFCVAVPAGWLMLLVICGAGVGALVLAVPVLRGALLALGVGYLLWLAWRLWGAGVLGEARAPARVGFVQGMALQFVNVKAWMLAMAMSAGWVAVPGADMPQVVLRLAIVGGTMVLFALASNSTYAAIGALLRQWLGQGRRLLWFNRALALALGATALWMLRV